MVCQYPKDPIPCKMLTGKLTTIRQYQPETAYKHRTPAQCIGTESGWHLQNSNKTQTTDMYNICDITHCNNKSIEITVQLRQNMLYHR